MCNMRESKMAKEQEIIKNGNVGRGSSRSWCRKNLHSSPPTNTTNLQLHIDCFLLKNNWELAEQSLHNKG